MRSFCTVFFLMSLSCQSQEIASKELMIFFEFLNSRLRSEQIEDIKDDTFSITDKMLFSKALTQELGKENKKSKSLVRFFETKGVEGYDTMAYIVANSYFEYLNSRDFNLNEIITEAKTLKKTMFEKSETVQQTAYNVYEKFNDGDNVKIKLPVVPVDKEKKSVLYFLDSKTGHYKNEGTLEVTGNIKRKFKIDHYPLESRIDYYFILILENISKKDVLYLMDEIEVGDEITIHLNRSPIVENSIK